MDRLSEVQEKLKQALYLAETVRDNLPNGGFIWDRACESAVKISEVLALLGGEQGEPGCHEPWCDSHELALCSGCSVLKGWDRSGVTGEPTTCREGRPHEWLPKPCSCGPNDQRKGDRRALTTERETEYRPWESEGITELAYWKKRYLEVRMEFGDGEPQEQHARPMSEEEAEWLRGMGLDPDECLISEAQMRQGKWVIASEFFDRLRLGTSTESEGT